MYIQFFSSIGDNHAIFVCPSLLHTQHYVAKSCIECTLWDRHQTIFIGLLVAALTTWQGFNCSWGNDIGCKYFVESYAWSSTCNLCPALFIAIYDNATHITLNDKSPLKHCQWSFMCFVHDAPSDVVLLFFNIIYCNYRKSFQNICMWEELECPNKDILLLQLTKPWSTLILD